jgi:hypothetical protein
MAGQSMVMRWISYFNPFRFADNMLLPLNNSEHPA